MDSRRDLIMAFVVLALGIFVIAVAQAIPAGIYRDAVGPKAFPLGIGLLFIVNATVLIVYRLRHMAADHGYQVVGEGTEDEPDLPASALRALGIVFLTFAYAATFQPLGYLIATPLYVMACLSVMSERRLWINASVSVIWTVVTYVMFAQGLNVRMPVGPLAQLFRDLGLIYL